MDDEIGLLTLEEACGDGLGSLCICSIAVFSIILLLGISSFSFVAFKEVGVLLDEDVLR